MSAAVPANRDGPFSLLIAALGGEGGGLLADWIVEAATHDGVLVQSTSIPGVAQRTGATTYYIEMMRPQPGADREPVFALYPAPGRVDLMVASELVEAGRALENGLVTPDRTTLIAATHRVYAMEEKTAMTDGAFESSRILRAAEELAAKCVLRDFRAQSLSSGAALNVLLLSAIAATGLCPISVQGFEAAIESRGVAVKANLAGFRQGLDFLRGEAAPEPIAEVDRSAAHAALPPPLAQRIADQLPREVAAIAEHGAARLLDYQDGAYAALYLDRLETILDAERSATGGREGFAVTRETAHPERLTFRGQIYREYWGGATTARKAVVLYGMARGTFRNARSILHSVLGLIELAVSPVFTVFGLTAFKRRALSGAKRLCHGIGRVRGIFGYQPQPYLNVVGR